MGNSYFQFKQFIIHQEKTAMKVCTDACLFGSYVAQNIPAKQVLDIGAGTGLLDLMYLQKNPTTNLTAIEIEENAFLQATENAASSLWKKNITIQNVALQQYQPDCSFDFILSNPPFFINDLKSESPQRNAAMHSTLLSLPDIFAFAKEHMQPTGKLALLLPFHRMEESKNIARKKSFYLVHKVLVRQTIQHNFFRSILIFSQNKTIATEQEIVIKNEHNQYGIDFVELLKDYYLFL